MPPLDRLQWLAIGSIVVAVVVVAWGFVSGQLKVRSLRGAVVLAALAVGLFAVVRDTLMGTDSDLVHWIAMGTVFVGGKYLKAPKHDAPESPPPVSVQGPPDP